MESTYNSFASDTETVTNAGTRNNSISFYLGQKINLQNGITVTGSVRSAWAECGEDEPKEPAPHTTVIPHSARR